MQCSVKEAFFKPSCILYNPPSNINNKYNSQIDYFSETKKIKEKNDIDEKLIRSIVDSINLKQNQSNTDNNEKDMYKMLYSTMNDLKYKNELVDMLYRSMNNQNKQIDCQTFMNHTDICNICKTYVKKKYNKNNLDILNLFTENKIINILLYIGLIIIGIKILN